MLIGGSNPATTLRVIHITAFSACVCGRRLRFRREIENFLSLRWRSPLWKMQTAASSVNQPLGSGTAPFSYNSFNCLTLLCWPSCDVYRLDNSLYVLLPLVGEHLWRVGSEVRLHLDVQVDLLIAADTKARELLLDSETATNVAYLNCDTRTQVFFDLQVAKCFNR